MVDMDNLEEYLKNRFPRKKCLIATIRVLADRNDQNLCAEDVLTPLINKFHPQSVRNALKKLERLQFVDIGGMPSTKRWGHYRIIYKLNDKFWSDYRDWVSRSDHASRFLRLPASTKSMYRIWEESKG